MIPVAHVKEGKIKDERRWERSLVCDRDAPILFPGNMFAFLAVDL